MGRTKKEFQEQFGSNVTPLFNYYEAPDYYGVEFDPCEIYATRDKLPVSQYAQDSMEVTNNVVSDDS